MKVLAFFNTLILYVLAGVLFYSYFVQFVMDMPPCSLCILQRFFLMGVGVPLCLNVTGVVSFKNIAAAILSCILGSVVSLYQWSMLLMNDGVSFAPQLLSLPMYIWAAMLFFVLALVLFFFLFFMKDRGIICRNWFINIGFALFSLMLISEVVATFMICGWFLC